MIDLRPDHLEPIKKILREHVPKATVLVFGSRAKGTAKKHSDLDLAVKGDARLSFSRLGDLKDAFSESNLPFKVDVVDWHRTSTEFQKVIQSQAVPLDFNAP